MTSMFTIVKGLDGCYLVKGGKLVKITRTAYSENYFLETSGWVEFELENGLIIRQG